MKADLHNHTTYSDGIYTIKEILNMDNDLDFIGITDHDTIDILDEKIDDKRIVYGIELSTLYNNKTVHLLGYFKNFAKLENLRLFLNNQKENRINRTKLMCEKLREYYNINISYEDVKNECKGIIARPHIASAISKKYKIPFIEAFNKYLSSDSKAYIPSSKLTSQEGIKLLREANCIVSIAHPCLYDFSIEGLLNLVDGIEAIYPKSDKQTTNYFIKLAKKYNLIVTGGSDFHGDSKHDLIATSYICGKMLEDFFKILKD